MSDVRDDPRRGPVQDSRINLLDEVADKAYDAIDFGDVPPEQAVAALRDAADEVERNEVDA